ncbi:MAG: tetratricopeptide repeat protein [Anaerolineales bacterium]|nr:tetratricopeptide repeat protein [Anaerolineales bacterium]
MKKNFKLPAHHINLLGREKDIAFLMDLLSKDEIRLVTLTGLGGIGKTTLTLQIASLLSNEFFDEVHFVNLVPLTHSEAIPFEIAHMLDVRQEAGKLILQSIAESLADRDTLLILDNFEHVMSGAGYVNQLLDMSPRLKVIVTSREPLGLRAEQVYPLSPLATDIATELFIQRARSSNPDFSPTHEDRLAIAELCNRLDGLPLAVELAAHRAGMFTPQAMLARLQPDLQPASRLLNFFSTGAKDLPERQQSLRKTIAWSYSLLNTDEQHALRFGSVFPGSFTIQQLAQLLCMDEMPAIDIVSSLVDKSLLKPSFEDEREARFSMLESIREFAWDEIRTSGELDELKSRYSNLYLELGKNAETGLRGSEQINWLKTLELEYSNLSLAIEIGVSAPVDSVLWWQGVEIFTSMEQYYLMRAFFNEFTEFSKRLHKKIDQMRSHNADSLSLQAKIYSLSGTTAWLKAEFEQAVNFHSKSLEIFRQLKDENQIAFALNNLAVNFEETGDQKSASDCYKESLALYEKKEDDWGLVRVNLNLFNYYCYSAKNIAEAHHYGERALLSAERLQDPFLISAASYTLGEIFFIEGNKQQAKILYEKSVQVCRQYGFNQSLTWALAGLAATEMEFGNLQAASDHIREGFPLAIAQIDKTVAHAYIRVTAWLNFELSNFKPISLLAGIESSLKDFVTRHGILPIFWDGYDPAVASVRAKIGETVFDAEFARGSGLSMERVLAFVNEHCLPNASVVSANDPLDMFTTRERDVLTLVAQGKTNEEISKELVVVLKTVEKHVANILRKLGVKNRTEASAWYLENINPRQNG